MTTYTWSQTILKIILVLSVVAFIGVWVETDSAKQAEIDKIVEAEEARSEVIKEQYKKVKIGMTIKEVNKLTTQKGGLIVEETTATGKLETYTYATGSGLRRTGTEMTIDTLEGVVVRKVIQ